MKEGLTVYRDQSFTADLHSLAIKRIEDVSFLRSHQFLEDSGPTSHAVKPNEYSSIDNFYTNIRLIFLVNNINEEIILEKKLIKGPPLDKCFDQLGKPTKTGLGFAKKYGSKNSILVDDIENLDLSIIDNNSKIGITASASSPEILVKKILKKIEESFELNIIESKYEQEDTHFKIPQKLKEAV